MSIKITKFNLMDEKTRETMAKVKTKNEMKKINK